MPIDSFLTDESQPNEHSLPLQVICDNKEVLEQNTEEIKLLHKKLDKLLSAKSKISLTSSSDFTGKIDSQNMNLLKNVKTIVNFGQVESDYISINIVESELNSSQIIVTCKL